jgi:hypothetical protein
MCITYGATEEPGGSLTETRSAEVASAKPASLAASTHLLATSLMSGCREQVILAALVSTPNALAMYDDGRDGSKAEPRPLILAGCISVAAAWSDAAIVAAAPGTFPRLRVVKALCEGGKNVIYAQVRFSGG